MSQVSGSFCPLTVITTSYRRPKEILITLDKILGTRPAPAEVLVHVDDNQTECEAAIRKSFPDVQTILSPTRVGPGGARNKLLATARNEIVASFDDDSYPIDSDYFDRVLSIFLKFPEAALLAASIFHREEIVTPAVDEFSWVSDFAGAGCAYRRNVFLNTARYVPIPIAYGMEEVDLALRLHASGKKILFAKSLRVFHDSRLEHHVQPEINGASIANLALLGYLRYPRSLWLTGVGQCLNRIRWLLKHGRWRGIISGLIMIPRHLRMYRQYRTPLSRNAVQSYLTLRRSPKLVKQ